MNDQTFSFKGVIQKAKEYLTNWKDLSRLMLIERASTIISGLILDISMVILGVIGLVFLSIALALFLAELLGSMALGFLVLAALYFLIILVIALLKTKIENKLINLSIRKILNKLNKSDEN